MKAYVLFVVTKLSLMVYAHAFDDHKWLGHNAFGYLEKIGIPEAKRVYEQENSMYMTPRIVGGKAADIVQYKYQAGLIVSMKNLTGFGLCGGSLISSNRVATAAHCWFDGINQGNNMTVVLGSKTVFSGGTRISTSEVYVHPGWQPSQARNDVAVIYLHTLVTISDKIFPIALPSESEIDEPHVGELVVASGFGKTGENIPVPSDQVLSEVNLTVISNDECLLTYPLVIHPSHICTSGDGGDGNVAICNGDSGGPLILRRNEKSTLIGIASFGYPGACDKNIPNGYSRVRWFLDFLKRHILCELE